MEYIKVGWKDGEMGRTPVSAANLDHMDNQILATTETLNNMTDTITEMSGDMAELKKSVSDGKKIVANAITAKGVATAVDASFQTMANNINKIGGAKYIGTYSSNISIDISGFKNKDVAHFIASCESADVACGSGDPAAKYSGRGSFTAPSISISGNTLTLAVGILNATAVTWGNGYGEIPANTNIATKLYYLGEITA